jgi:hypothetical protein
MGILEELVEKWGFVDVDGELQSKDGKIYSTREKEWDGEEYYYEYTFHFCGQSFSESEIIELLEQHKEEQEEQNG